jgi:hypothetical protein
MARENMRRKTSAFTQTNKKQSGNPPNSLNMSETNEKKKTPTNA